MGRKIYNNSTLDFNQEQLLAYVRGEFSDSEMELAQKHLLTCDFCKDAVEGLSANSLNIIDSKYFEDLNKKIDSRVENEKKNESFSWIAIAAILCLFITGGILYFYTKDEVKIQTYSEKTEIRSTEPSIQADEKAEEIEEKVIHENDKAKEPSKKLYSGNNNDVVFNAPDAPVSASKPIEPVAEGSESSLREEIVNIEAIRKEMGDEMLAFADQQIFTRENTLIPKSSLAPEENEVVTNTKNSAFKKRAEKADDERQTSAPREMENARTSAPSAAPAKSVMKSAEPISSSETNEEGYTIQKGIELYKSGSYIHAIEVFNNILLKDISNHAALTYRAMAKLKLGKEVETISDLEKSPSNFQYSDIKWLKSCAYLKIGDKEKALSLLEELSKSNNLYREKAKLLFEKLKDK